MTDNDYTLLIVEDMLSCPIFWQIIFPAFSFRIQTAIQGKEAIEQINKSYPDPELSIVFN